MKNLIIFALLALSIQACSENQTLEIGQKTSIRVNPTFNGGDVLLGEEVLASFKVSNEGDYPLVISEVKGSCSCTVADYPKEPIAPGKTGIIHATVRTENAAVGKLVKEVRMVANTEPSITVMHINANVIRK